MLKAQGSQHLHIGYGWNIAKGHRKSFDLRREALATVADSDAGFDVAMRTSRAGLKVCLSLDRLTL